MGFFIKTYCSINTFRLFIEFIVIYNINTELIKLMNKSLLHHLRFLHSVKGLIFLADFEVSDNRFQNLNQFPALILSVDINAR